MEQDVERERLLSLIEFAKQSASLRQPLISDVSGHKDFHAYEHSLQGMPGLHFNVDCEDDEKWLVVERLHHTPPPKPKDVLLGLWLEISDNPSKEPSLKPQIERGCLVQEGAALSLVDESQSTEQNFVLLKDFEKESEVHHGFEHYLKSQWKPWAAEEKKTQGDH